ncbi:MAG: DUF1566 domain-containing protein [Campylobacterales bacterium]|nr:DUF1566 domain-containing protein [Campylobacterales bacterium]
MKIFYSIVATSTLLYAHGSYINVTSDIPNANVFLNDKLIGKTPLVGYLLDLNTTANIVVDLNDSYHLSANTTIIPKENTIQTVRTTLKKGSGILSFIGEDATLYINSKKIKDLRDDNRIFSFEANPELKIELYKENKLYKTSVDLKKESLKEITYTLKEFNKELSLYTLIDENLMWQDHPEAKTTKEYYKEALKYCEKLDLAGFQDWRLPTMEELKSLYEIKEKIYNGFGDMHYWSSDEYNTTKASSWEYGYAFSFDKDSTEKKIKDFYKGNIRCVRNLQEGDLPY